MVIADEITDPKSLETIEPKTSKRYDESKTELSENEPRFKSLGRPSIIEKESRTCSNSKRLDKRRVNT